MFPLKGVTNNDNEDRYNSNTIIITNVNPTAKSVNMGAAFAPFHGNVWLVIVLTIITTGISYHVNDYIMHRGERDERDELGANIFKSFLAFMGNITFDPRFFPNRILSVSISFLCLVLVATYTAQLASFLVNENRVQPIQRFQDVITNGYRVCVWKGTAYTMSIQFEYPDAIYVEKATEPQVYQGLIDNDCDVALVSEENHNAFVNKFDYNPNCDLIVVGFPVRYGTASFALKNELQYCSAIVHNVFDIYILEMIADGNLDKIKKVHNLGSNDCKAFEAKEEESLQLSMYDLSGLFAIHFILLFIAFTFVVLHIMYPNVIKANILGDTFNVKTKSVHKEVLQLRTEVQEIKSGIEISHKEMKSDIDGMKSDIQKILKKMN